MLSKMMYKIKHTYHLRERSPTHYQLIQSMKNAGFRCVSRSWQARFSEHNLNFSADACECLEFKHRLAQLVNAYCPEVMPETYPIDDINWSMILSDIAERYYTISEQYIDELPEHAWILKPALLNNGQYIQLFTRLSDIEAYFLHPRHMGGPYVLQRYITQPDLQNACKYSVRMFVVLNQAGAFLYPQGYLNVALKPYASADFSDLSRHLTNEHLNPTEKTVVQIPMTPTQTSELLPDISSIVHKIASALKHAFPYAFLPNRNPQTLAFFGFDFLIDHNKRVWLLEANHGPCFPVDESHALQQPVYQGFWDAVFHQFVLPIVHKKTILLQDNHGFIPITGTHHRL